MSRYHWTLILFVLALLVSCSTRKDAFLNREWHGLNTKYNVLYNGELALEKGKAGLITSYRDNFWEVLPVERLKVDDQVRLDGIDVDPDFERAEEKAIKAVQKHGMYLQGEERNKQIDRAYLLLGQSRYYDQRFVPALEAFTMVLKTSRREELVNRARIWREKTYLRLEQDELALSNLKKLFRYSDLKGEDEAEANATMAQAYINLKYPDSAIQRLKLAVRAGSNDEANGRYLFIIGQLYNRLQKPDSANLAFQKVIDLNRRVPRSYWMNAQVEYLSNINELFPDQTDLIASIEKLERNPENRPYSGRILRLKALYFLQRDSVELARMNLQRSVRAQDADTVLKFLDYRDLAQMDLDQRSFVRAGLYLDSTLAHLDLNTKEYRLLSRRRESLEDLILNDGLKTRNDSILRVLEMGLAERESYYSDFIAQQKAREELLRQKASLELLKASNRQNRADTFQAKEGEFYFYNPESVTRGRLEFARIWGKVALADNWKFGRGLQMGEAIEYVKSEEQPGEEIRDVQWYLDQLPEDPEAIDSIKTERDRAYLRLAQLYQERFDAPEEAIRHLEELLGYMPESSVELPALYRLSVLLKDGHPERAAELNNRILTQYPQSRYAALIREPGSVETDKESPEALYQEAYQALQSEEYFKVLELADRGGSQLGTAELTAKFEYLKAAALARLDGLEAYVQALEYIANTYPETAEGKKAAEHLSKTVPKLKSLTYLPTDPEERLWKLVYPFQRAEGERLGALKEKVERSLEDLQYPGVTWSVDIFDRNTLFLVVHGLGSQLRVLGYAELLMINKDYKVKDRYFVISSGNYQVLQSKKDLNEYLSVFDKINPNLK